MINKYNGIWKKAIKANDRDLMLGDDDKQRQKKSIYSIDESVRHSRKWQLNQFAKKLSFIIIISFESAIVVALHFFIYLTYICILAENRTALYAM